MADWARPQRLAASMADWARPQRLSKLGLRWRAGGFLYSWIHRFNKILIWGMVLIIGFFGVFLKSPNIAKASISQNGSSSGQYPPGDFGVTWSTWSTDDGIAHPKLDFFWQKPSPDPIVPSENSDASFNLNDNLYWALNVRDSTGHHILWTSRDDKSTIGVPISYDTLQADFTPNTADLLNPDNSTITDQWGIGYTAQLELRRKTESNPNIGQANISFTLPDKAPSITSTPDASTECPPTVQALIEYGALQEGKTSVHLSWKFSNTACDQRYSWMKISFPSGLEATSRSGEKSVRYVVDPLNGVYKFSAMDSSDKEIGRASITIDDTNNGTGGVSVTGAAGNPATGGNLAQTATSPDTCGVNTNNFVTGAIARVLCSIITGIADLANWISSNILQGVFNAYMDGGRIFV